LQANRNNITGTYLIMLVYRHLLTIMLTWQSGCIIANYNQKTSEIYLTLKIYSLAIYFDADDTRENIVPVIDRGVFHYYVHVCKQLFLCDIIRSRNNLSTPFS